jgi:PadR family transcriptional regulator PadR
MGRSISKGDIPMLVMAVLAEAPSHGYAIAREIERRSGQGLGIKEGTLYPALRVLEQNQLIAGEWDTAGSGPARKVYRLTADGHRELEKARQSWREYTQAFNQILGGNDAKPA